VEDGDGGGSRLHAMIPLPYGNFAAILRDPLGFQRAAQRRLGDVLRFRNGPFLLHFLYHPDHVRRVLQERQKQYLRSWQYRLLKRLFGGNLVVSEGPYWLRQRRLAQGAFHRERLAAYVGAMVDATEQMLSEWREREARGEAIEGGFGSGAGNNIGNLFYGSEGYMTVDLQGNWQIYLGKDREAGPGGAYRLGCTLEFDRESQQFRGDDEANKMLTREYREPYVIPQEV